MEIRLNRGEVIFEDTNVRVDVRFLEMRYAVDENGRRDFTKSLGEDVTDNALKMLSSPLEDLFYYRDREFDSTELIKQAFDKLPDDKMTELLKYLNENYE